MRNKPNKMASAINAGVFKNTADTVAGTLFVLSIMKPSDHPSSVSYA